MQARRPARGEEDLGEIHYVGQELRGGFGVRPPFYGEEQGLGAPRLHEAVE